MLIVTFATDLHGSNRSTLFETASNVTDDLDHKAAVWQSVL